MKRKAGILLMVLGTGLIFAALLLFLYNEREDNQAKEATEILLPKLIEEIQNEPNENFPAEMLNVPKEVLKPEDLKMNELVIDGYSYIGYLSIPDISLDLPIMADWDYERLKIAPCRYTGSVRGENLVLMAHNYAHHFGQLNKLNEGEQVTFLDVDGNVYHYEVVAKDVLEPTAVVEMTSGDFDLTLFTCTYGGAQRITVYCDRID